MRYSPPFFCFFAKLYYLVSLNKKESYLCINANMAADNPGRLLSLENLASSTNF